MHHTTVIGYISGKAGRPTELIDYERDAANNIVLDEKTGEQNIIVRRFFTLWVENRRLPYIIDPNGGPSRPHRDPVKINIPNSKRGENLFPHLEPGRLVMITGDEIVTPRTANNVLYKNITIFADDIRLLDSPRSNQTERALKDMLLAEVIIEEEYKSQLKRMKQFYEERMADPRNAPRLYIDKRKEVQNIPEENPDPDMPDFESPL